MNFLMNFKMNFKSFGPICRQMFRKWRPKFATFLNICSNIRLISLIRELKLEDFEIPRNIDNIFGEICESLATFPQFFQIPKQLASMICENANHCRILEITLDQICRA